MPSPKPLDQARERPRVKRYSLRTEDVCPHRIGHFIFFHGNKHPREMGGREAEVFLSHLTTAERVSDSKQNQMLSARLFVGREVLKVELL